MTTVKFTLKFPANIDGRHPIFIRLTKDRKNRTLSLKHSVKIDDWSYETQRVKSKNKNHKKINKFIEKYSELIENKINELELQGVHYTLSELVELIRSGLLDKPKEVINFTSFQERLIDDLKKSKKIGTANTNKDMLNAISRFSGSTNISFDEITASYLDKFETFMRSTGCASSTIGIRMRTLRSTINKAIKHGLLNEEAYPFKNYKIPKQSGGKGKEILTKTELQRLKNYIPENEQEQRAKDLFLFSYYCRGINFIDVIQLKRSDVSFDSITYARSKTGAIVTFKLNDFQKEIINLYKNINPMTPFLFNFLKSSHPDENTIKNLNHKLLKEINRSLKSITAKLDIAKNITYYCARHTFATHLKFNNISIDIIKEALGHKDINSTISYLRNLPSKKLDQIIDSVIN